MKVPLASSKGWYVIESNADCVVLVLVVAINIWTGPKDSHRLCSWHMDTVSLQCIILTLQRHTEHSAGGNRVSTGGCFDLFKVLSPMVDTSAYICFSRDIFKQYAIKHTCE